MRRTNLENWVPNSMEKKCLDQLDSSENWESFIKSPKPPESEHLSWRPFFKIFLFNLAFFSLIVTLLFGVIAAGTLGIGGLREDIVAFLALILTIAVATASYVTNLYRRTWNRRAAQQRLFSR